MPINKHTPDNFIIPNSKVANKLTCNLMNTGDWDVVVGKDAVRVSLICDDENVHLPSNFDAYDRAIMNAVSSEWAQGNTFIWAARIHRTMAGKKDSERVNEATVENIESRLDKMMRSTVRIDFTDQLRRYGGMETDSTVIEGNLIYAEKITSTVNGATISGYRLIESPIIYEYSHRFRQIISIPLKLLDTGSTVRNTPENITIKHYLLQRIEMAKNSKNHMNGRILLTTLFRECHLTVSNRNQKSRYKRTIERLLEHWKSRLYIKNYTYLNSGFDIDL